MSLLDEIIGGAADDAVSTSNLLRKVQIVAHRVGSAELTSWVKNELNGYEDTSALPNYRKVLTTPVQGNWSGPFGSSASLSVSSAGVPDEHRERLFSTDLKQPIVELEQLAASEQDPGVGWDPYFIGLYNEWISEGRVPHIESMGLISARQIQTRVTIRGVIETSRNTALEFAIDLHESAPSAGEAGGPTIQDPPVASTVYNVTNNIFGDGASVAHGSGTSQNSAVAKGDLEGLLRLVREAGLVDPEAQAELAAAVTADVNREDRSERFLGRVRQGSFMVGAGVASDLLATQIGALITEYLG